MENEDRRRRWQHRLPLIVICLATMAWTASCQGQVSTGNPTAVTPREWAVSTATNEIAILQHAGSYLRYRMHVVDEKGDQIRDVIESKDGTVARLVVRDGRPLTPEEDAAERQRLEGLLAEPEAYARHVRNETKGKKLAAEMVGMMPDAMLFTYAPGQPQIAGDQGAGEVVLDYHPNPQWTPPTTAAEALTGLQGRMWIDVKTRQLLRMDGEIFRPVNIGYGMLARVYPGGQMMLEQTNAGGSRWIYKHFKQDIDVRALMVKPLHVHTQVDASDFQVLPGGMGYQEAIRRLLATPLPTG